MILMQNMKFRKKKIKKLNEELANNKRQLGNVLQKNVSKAHEEIPAKKQNEERKDNGYNKAEIRKLNLQIISLKNDNKKKELEFNKLQEKIKKLLNDKINSSTISSEKFYNNNNNNGNGNSSYSINTFNPNLAKNTIKENNNN